MVKIFENLNYLGITINNSEPIVLLLAVFFNYL